MRQGHRLSATRSITFAEGGDGDVEALPSVIIDQMGNHDLFFVMNWKTTNEENYLQVKELKDE